MPPEATGESRVGHVEAEQARILEGLPLLSVQRPRPKR